MSYNTVLKRVRSFLKAPEMEIVWVQLASDGFYFDTTKEDVICSECLISYAKDGTHRKSCSMFSKSTNVYESRLNNLSVMNSNESIYSESSDSNCSSLEDLNIWYNENSTSAVRKDALKKNHSDTNFQDFIPNVKSNSKSSFLENDLSVYANRLQTFQYPENKWPLSNIVNEEELAEAGFCFLGIGDKVQCFSCKGILKKWSLGDLPWGEHKKHFPFCPHVVQHQDRK